MAGRHRSDHVAIKVPDEPGSPTHSRHAGHALRGQSACPRPQYPTLRGNRTIKNEAKEKPRVGNIRFYPPATRRQENILHRTAKICTSTPSANNFLPPRPLSAIARVNTANSTRCASRWAPRSATKPSPRGFPRSRRKRGLAGMEHERHAAQCGGTTRRTMRRHDRQRASHHPISPIKCGLQPVMTTQGRICARMPIVLSFSAIGRSHPGNPG